MPCDQEGPLGGQGTPPGLLKTPKAILHEVLTLNYCPNAPVFHTEMVWLTCSRGRGAICVRPGIRLPNRALGEQPPPRLPLPLQMAGFIHKPVFQATVSCGSWVTPLGMSVAPVVQEVRQRAAPL